MRSTSQVYFCKLLFIGFLLLSASDRSFAVNNGDLDIAFHNGGFTRFGFGGGADSGRAIVRQPDGKILIAARAARGSRMMISVIRYMPDGSLDRDFGEEGRSLIWSGNDDSEPNALAIQPDGKIVVAGTNYSIGYGKDFLVARLNADGVLDWSFGANGVTLMNFVNKDDQVRGVAITPDNKVLVAGTVTPSLPGESHFAVARFTSGGVPDVTFNGTGRVTAEAGPATSLALQPDGKIIVGGSCNTGGSYKFCALRFTADGPLDISLNGSGRMVWLDTGRYTGVALQPDGKLAFVGQASDGIGVEFARFNADGTPDANFGTGGTTRVNIEGYGTVNISSMVLQPDGKILASGSVMPSLTESFIAAVRVDANGSLDQEFDGDGKLVVSAVSGLQTIYAAVAEPDGGILMVGEASTGSMDTLLCKFAADGSFDPSYGDNGVQRVDVGDEPATARAMVLQPDGKVVIAGNRLVDGPRVARLNPDGSLDLTFNGTGKLVLANWNETDVTALVVQADEKILIAGNFSGRFMVGRIDRWGTIDETFGTGGRIVVPSATARAIAVQADGKILVGGSSTSGYAVMRFNEDGTPDRFFGRAGIFTMPGITVTGIVVQPDGKILTAGQDNPGGGTIFLVTRLNPNGTFDVGFGKDGVVRTDVTAWNDYATSIALSPEGKIAVAGYVPVNDKKWFIVAKYNDDGTLDASFNGTGTNTTYGAGEDPFLNTALAVAFRFDGKIFLAGTYQSPSRASIATARFNLDGTWDRQAWGQFGAARANLDGLDYGVAMALDTYGRPLVAGTCTELFCLTRFTSEYAPAFPATISGRMTNGLKPLVNAVITFIAPDGCGRVERSNAYGLYRFDNLRTGLTYRVLIQAKGHSFSQRYVTVSGDNYDIHFSPG